MKTTLRWACGLAAAIALLAAVSVPAPVAVLLSWTANTETNLAGYKIYCGTNSRLYDRIEDVGNVTCAAISNLQDCVTHYFAATAYDTEGVESDFSQEVSFRPSCAGITVLMSTNLGGPWDAIWQTNLPVKIGSAFFNTRISLVSCTNVEPVGVEYICTNGILVTNYVDRTNGGKAYMLIPPLPPGSPGASIGPLTNLFD